MRSTFRALRDPQLPPVRHGFVGLQHRHVDAARGAGLAGPRCSPTARPRSVSPPACSSCRFCCSRRTPVWSATGSPNAGHRGHPDGDGSHRRHPRRTRGYRGGGAVARLRAGAMFGTGTAFDVPNRQAFVSEMVGARQRGQRGRPQLRIVQPRPGHRPRARRTAHRLVRVRVWATGWVILLNGVSYVAIVGAILGMRRRELCTPEPVARAKGMIRDGLRYVRFAQRRDADPRDRVLCRHVRAELPDDDGDHGDPGLRQGCRGVRPARHGDGRRLAGRRAAGGAAYADPATTGDRRDDRVRRGRDRCGHDAHLHRLRDRASAVRPVRAHDDHGRQHLRAARGRPADARARDGAVHGDLHGRHSARRADPRLGRRGVRRAGGR